MKTPLMTTKTISVMICAAVVLAAAGAGANPKASCTIEPFTYGTPVSRIIDGRLVYSAAGVTNLTGASCPFDGRTVQVQELVEYTVDTTENIIGRYAAQWSDATGLFEVVWRGHARVLSSLGSGSFEQVVHAQSPGGAQLQLEQAGEIDLTQEHPLVSIECLCGVLAIPIGS